MMVVMEIKTTYFGAELLYRLFTRAREVIDSRCRALEPTAPSAETDEGGVLMREDREDHDGETAGSASPIVPWTPNTANNCGHGTGARYVFSFMRPLAWVNGT